MKKVSKETLIIATRKLMMEMSDEEYDKLTSDFETITMQMDLIKDIIVQYFALIIILRFNLQMYEKYFNPKFL